MLNIDSSAADGKGAFLLSAGSAGCAHACWPKEELKVRFERTAALAGREDRYSRFI